MNGEREGALQSNYMLLVFYVTLAEPTVIIKSGLVSTNEGYEDQPSIAILLWLALQTPLPTQCVFLLSSLLTEP